MSYKTIRNRTEASFTEKKSEFIGYISPAGTEEEAIGFINEIRAMHRKATHNCYAYILRNNNTGRHSDDGEPGGTAGMPIYDVLSKNGITDVVCVVTRYFGGILLGTGGLVHAYSKGASMALANAEIVNMEVADSLKISCDYTMYGIVNSVLPEFESIISGKTGDFFEKDNVEDLARCISNWFTSKSGSRDEVRKACYKEIDEYWNPHYQLNVIKKTLDI